MAIIHQKCSLNDLPTGLFEEHARNPQILLFHSSASLKRNLQTKLSPSSSNPYPIYLGSTLWVLLFHSSLSITTFYNTPRPHITVLLHSDHYWSPSSSNSLYLHCKITLQFFIIFSTFYMHISHLKMAFPVFSCPVKPNVKPI